MPGRHAQRSRARGALAIAAALCAAGGASLLWSVLAPEQVDHALGAVVGAASQQVQQLQRAASGQEVPIVRLGGPGGQAEMDRCAGDFVHMVRYEQEEPALQPTYSAHNGCGGDVLLPWAIGQEVDVVSADGATRRYVVTDSRDTPQFTTTASQLLDLDGEMLLQTCYWHTDAMRFVALTPTG